MIILQLATHFLLPQQVRSQELPTDVLMGFWIGAGLVHGSIDCKVCDAPTAGPGASLTIGGSLSRSILLSASWSGWRDSQEPLIRDSTPSEDTAVHMLIAEIHIRPVKRLGAVFIGGVGKSWIRNSATSAGFHRTFSTATYVLAAGFGWNIAMGDTITLRPFAARHYFVDNKNVLPSPINEELILRSYVLDHIGMRILIKTNL